jgi:membrane associated rhomboid family serine protease
MRADSDVALRVTRGRLHADEWALVLTAEGLAPRIWGSDSGFVVGVAPEHAERAREILDAYDRENRSERVEKVEPPLPDGPGSLRVAIGVSGALLCFFAYTGPRRATTRWFERGSCDAELAIAGEAWRTVTALTLHADLGHVASNALIGAVFFVAVFRWLGPGLGLGLVLLAGAAGNLANALYYGTAHDSIGASTAVFGAVGLLGGLGVGRRRRIGTRGSRAWVSIGAAFGLLAMLGTSGERVDLWAHAFGLLAGGLIGLPLGFLAQPRPPPAVQWLLGLAALSSVLGSWSLALR